MSIDLSLDRIRVLLSKFEKYTRRTIHVAGTNGKGSVCALLTSIFLAADPPLSVGRFNSPHLVDITDCITINGVAISRTAYDNVYTEVKDVNDRQSIAASGFEILTVTALLVFERHNVDIVVCEVGMGGRLDATNVIPDEAILASVITSIDLDHQAFLGSTVAAIAREKGGIIRRNKPVILSRQKHPEVVEVIKAIAEKQEALLSIAPSATTREWNVMIDGEKQSPFSLNPFSPPPPTPVSVRLSDVESCDLLLPLLGDHQRDNLGAVVTLLKDLDFLPATTTSNIRKGVRQCFWPGRLSFHIYKSSKGEIPQLPILADGAHNEAASEVLGAYISSLLKDVASGDKKTINLTYIIALSNSPPKTPASVLRPLLSVGDKFGADNGNVQLSVRIAALRFTPPSGMPWVKSVPPSAILQAAEDTAVAGCNGVVKESWSASDDEVDDAGRDLVNALEWASEWSRDVNKNAVEHLVVLAGSLYLVADLYRLLGENNQQQP